MATEQASTNTRKPTALKLSSENFLPLNERPQDAPFLSDERGARSRVIHLSRFSRLTYVPRHRRLPFQYEHTLASTDLTRKESSYSARNAAFQTLIHQPLFINFLRSHVRHWKGNCPINFKHSGKCLACKFHCFAGRYFDESVDKEKHMAFLAALKDLWEVCQKSFWGPSASSVYKAGPKYSSDKCYADAFLLHFLSEMQRQFETSPAEHETFLRLFTIEWVLQYECPSQHTISREASPVKWFRSLYLSIDVEKANIKPTDMLRGVHAALGRRAQALMSRDLRANIVPTCSRCSSLTQPNVKIANFPEFLVLVPNLDPLQSKQKPSIVLVENLDFTPFSLHGTKTSFTLTAGTVEQRTFPNEMQAMAYFRAGAGDKPNFVFVGDRGEELDKSFSDVDHVQRGVNDVLPEVYLYLRTDDIPTPRIFHQDINVPVPFTPVANPHQRMRDEVGRQIDDLFVRKIGNGILKFKVAFAPADPGPQESVPYSLNIAYEYNGNHWTSDHKIWGRLVPPALAEETDVRKATPEQAMPYSRYMRRQQGLTTPRVGNLLKGHADDASINDYHPGSHGTAINFDDLSTKFGTTGVPGFSNNPFADVSQHGVADGMDLDAGPAGFEVPANYRQQFEQKQTREAADAQRRLANENTFGNGQFRGNSQRGQRAQNRQGRNNRGNRRNSHTQNNDNNGGGDGRGGHHRNNNQGRGQNRRNSGAGIGNGRNSSSDNGGGRRNSNNDGGGNGGGRRNSNSHGRNRGPQQRSGGNRGRGGRNRSRS